MQPSREAEILISEHEPGLRAFVVACVRDRQATDDLLQETFLAAWGSLDQYDESRPFAVALTASSVCRYARQYVRHSRLFGQQFGGAPVTVFGWRAGSANM